MTPTVHHNTREVLLENAAELLQTVGYASFSFRTLGERVGISSASIHYHFPSKADLGLALVDWLRAKVRPEIEMLCEATPNMRNRLLALADHMAEHTCVSGKSCPINILLSEFAVLPPELQTAVREWVTAIIDSLAAWLDQGRQRGELIFPGDPATQARLVWSVIEHGTQMERTGTGQAFIPLMRHLVETMTPSSS